MGISWGYLGDILAISWGYLGNILGISWEYLGDHWFICPLVHWSIGPLVHWSFGPLVPYDHWTIGPWDHWSICPLVNHSISPLVHWSIGPNINKVKLLSERTSGVPPVIFSFQGIHQSITCRTICNDQVVLCINVQNFILVCRAV